MTSSPLCKRRPYIHNGSQKDEYVSWKAPKELYLELIYPQHSLAGSWLVHQRLNTGSFILWFVEVLLERKFNSALALYGGC